MLNRTVLLAWHTMWCKYFNPHAITKREKEKNLRPLGLTGWACSWGSLSRSRGRGSRSLGSRSRSRGLGRCRCAVGLRTGVASTSSTSSTTTPRQKTAQLEMLESQTEDYPPSDSLHKFRAGIPTQNKSQSVTSELLKIWSKYFICFNHFTLNVCRQTCSSICMTISKGLLPSSYDSQFNSYSASLCQLPTITCEAV
jgi:hypothetical protein